MDDMKAKELFEAGPGERPPGPGGPPRRPLPRRPAPAPAPAGDPDDPMAMMGGPNPVQRMVGREGPKAQFDENELSQLKDVLIQILARAANSGMDAEIGQALMQGQPLNPGQLQHILDEARQIELPESHNALMQKLFTTLRSPQ